MIRSDIGVLSIESSDHEHLCSNCTQLYHFRIRPERPGARQYAASVIMLDQYNVYTKIREEGNVYSYLCRCRC